MWKRALIVFALASSSGPVLAAQPAHDEQTPTIRTTTREVVLDVIVRDKHHHALADLRPGDLEVYEDGVKQKINAFRNVEGKEQLQLERAQAKSATAAGTTEAPKPNSTALRELNFVSVVFANIAPLNLEFARQAVLEFLKSDTLPNTYVTVYRLDRGFTVLRPYTADKGALISAVNSAAKGLNTRGESSIATVAASGSDALVRANASAILASPATTVATAQAVTNTILNPIPDIVADPLWGRNAASQDVSVTLGNALVTQARLETGLRSANSLSNGMDAMDALRELIRAQAKLPGRKVVLYLADGLTLPKDRRDVVSGIISFANQMEVSFYTVDTRGLSVDDPMAQALSDQERVQADSSANRVSPRMGHMEGDDIQLAATASRQLAMQELAEATGGFAVANTNQIAIPMQRVMEDIRTHYEVAYTPSSSNYDGHFRKIEVRVSRPHVTVQTRSGYFAVPDINGEPLQPFEITALRAINTRPMPVNFPYGASLLRFRPKGAAVEYQVAFEVPIAGLRVMPDPKTGGGHIRLSVLALIHKTDGEVVGKLSRDLVREVPKAELPHIADQKILYIEPVELAGGHYLVDTAVTDQLAKRTTARRMAVFVNSGSDFGVSSLQVVKRIQPLPPTRNAQDPFETDRGRVVPTLSDSMPSGTPIGIYFVVYPVPGSDIQPTIVLQIYRDGHKIAQRALGDLHPQDDGSIPILLQVTPDPGECDMVVTAQQGEKASEARLSIKVAPDGSPSSN